MITVGPADAAGPLPRRPSRAATWRVCLTHLCRQGRLPQLEDPVRFNDLVQARKLHDRVPGHAPLLDKLAVKARVRQVLGGAWVTPTLWSGPRLPDAPPFACPAMVKARHGCNQNAALIEPPGPAHWRRLQRQTAAWTRKPYGLLLDEWAYRDVPRGLLAEPLLGDGTALPVDYKVFVFGGRATHVQVHLDRRHDHRWILHDRAWRQLAPVQDRPPPPRSLPAMLAAAEALAGDIDFVRIDFYEIAGLPRFGEFCLYPGSGLHPFAADWIDLELGGLWRAAKLARTG